MAEMTAAEYRAMALGAMRIASSKSELLDRPAELGDGIYPAPPNQQQRETLNRELAIALQHASIYAQLAASRSAETIADKALAFPVPQEPRKGFWRRVAPKAPWLRGR